MKPQRKSTSKRKVREKPNVSKTIKRQWFLSKEFIGIFFPSILFVLAIIINQFVCNNKAQLDQIKKNQQGQSIVLKEQKKMLQEQRIILDVVDSVIKNYAPTPEQYQQRVFNFDTNSRNYEDIYKKLNSGKITQNSKQLLLVEKEKLQRKVDTVQNFAKQMSNFNYPKWAQYFPYGYTIFYIGIDQQLHTYPVLYHNIDVSWNDLKIEELTNSSLTLILPAVSISSNHINLNGDDTLRIDRKPDQLNKLVSTIRFNNMVFAAGLLSDDRNGITGLVGLGNISQIYKGKKIYENKAAK